MLLSLPSLSNIAGNNMDRQIRKKSRTGIKIMGNGFNMKMDSKHKYIKGNTHPGEKGYKIVTSKSSMWDKFKHKVSNMF